MYSHKQRQSYIALIPGHFRGRKNACNRKKPLLLHYFTTTTTTTTHTVKIIIRAPSCDDDKNIGGKQNKKELFVIIAIIKKEPSPSLHTHTQKIFLQKYNNNKICANKKIYKNFSQTWWCISLKLTHSTRRYDIYLKFHIKKGGGGGEEIHNFFFVVFGVCCLALVDASYKRDKLMMFKF